MIGYYLSLAFKSIKSTPAVSLITILGIGIGIAVSTTMITIFHVFSQDPIPAKSDRIFNVRMDSWDPNAQFFNVRPGDPPKQITYRDMAGIMVSDIPVRQTGVGMARAYFFPENEINLPSQETLSLVHADFFALFDAPFLYGQPWKPSSDERRDRVVVLTYAKNQQLFGGADSVGKTLRLGSGNFTVVGVLKTWMPTPLCYDVINNPYGEPNPFFVPFDLIREQDLGFTRVGDSDNWGDFRVGDNPDSFFTGSETCWVQFWAELRPGNSRDYAAFIDSYSEEQKAIGRFPRPLNNRVTPMLEWMDVRNITPPATIVLMIISLLFLLVCALNLMGLLLAKFLSRANLVGVHRALGATRGAVFLHHILECKLVGILGGVGGVVAASIALGMINSMVPSNFVRTNMFQLDGTMVVTAIGLSLLASLVAGFYPAWRACSVVPAVQVKLQ